MNHIIDHSTATVNWTDAEARTNIAAFQGWLAEGGPGNIKVFDFSGHVMNPPTTYGEDAEMQRYWMDLSRSPQVLEYKAILGDTVWDRQIYDMLQLGFGNRYADRYYDKETQQLRWYVRPQWELLNQVRAAQEQNATIQSMRLHARTATMQAAWHVLFAGCLKHGLETELPDLQHMIWARLDDETGPKGVSSADVERSDYVKQHGSKLGHGKGRF